MKGKSQNLLKMNQNSKTECSGSQNRSQNLKEEHQNLKAGCQNLKVGSQKLKSESQNLSENINSLEVGNQNLEKEGQNFKISSLNLSEDDHNLKVEDQNFNVGSQDFDTEIKNMKTKNFIEKPQILKENGGNFNMQENIFKGVNHNHNIQMLNMQTLNIQSQTVQVNTQSLKVKTQSSNVKSLFTTSIKSQDSIATAQNLNTTTKNFNNSTQNFTVTTEIYTSENLKKFQNTATENQNFKNEIQEFNSEISDHLFQNRINFNNERSSSKNSSDSGFRSSTTDQIHDIGVNFTCKCTGINAKNKNETNSSIEVIYEKTMINLEETYNERCVDVPISNRKRNSSTSESSSNPKRPNLENSGDFTLENSCDLTLENKGDFTLKRQKCIRRRKFCLDSKEKRFSSVQRMREDNFLIVSDDFIGEHSFDSNFTEKCNETTPEMKISFDGSSHLQNGFVIETPLEQLRNARRTRRCLLFETPEKEDQLEIEYDEKTYPSVDVDVKVKDDRLEITGKFF